MQQTKTQQLMDEVHQWADKTFGADRKVSAVAHHLFKESQELIEALDLYREYPTEINKIKAHKEFADCFILILNAASKFGLTVENLNTFSFNKMEENKSRVWGSPDKNGVVEHVKNTNHGI